MKNTSVMSFNRFNHGPNFNPHEQYDYINPTKLSDSDVPIHSPNTCVKLWEFNLSPIQNDVKKALRTFHIEFDMLDMLKGANTSAIHFDISAAYLNGKPEIACSKRYNSIDQNTVAPLDYINIHIFYKQIDNYYQIKIYLQTIPGTFPMLYNSRFWNMTGYDPEDKQFYPSIARTYGSQLQITRWLMRNAGHDWVSAEQMMADTEGYTHVVAEMANFRTGRNLLKGTLDFNADNWQIPTAGALETIDGHKLFRFTTPNQVPFNLNQEVELVAGHHYTISFTAKAAQRSVVNFEFYGIGQDSGSFSLKPVSFFMDEKVRRYSIDFIGTGKKIKRFMIKPVLHTGDPISNVGGGVWLGQYTLNDVAYDRDWRPFNE